MRTACILSVLWLLIACQYRPSGISMTGQDSTYGKLAASIPPSILTNDMPARLALIDSILPLAAQRHPEMVPFWNAYKGQTFAAISEPDSARTYLSQALPQGVRPTTSDSVAFLYHHAMTHLYLSANKVDSALQAATLAYDRGRQLSLPGKLRVIDLLANIYTSIGDTTNVRKYISEGLLLDTAHQISSEFLTYQAIYFQAIGQLDSAEWSIGLAANDTLVEPMQRAMNLGNQAHFKNLRGKTNEALTDYLHVADLLRRLDVVNPTIHSNIADILWHTGQRARAILYYDSAIARGQALGFFDEARTSSERVAQQLQQQGDHEGANRYLQKAMQVNRQQDSAAMREKIHEIETRLGVKIKDEQIRAVNSERQAALATSQKRIVIIIGLSLVFLLAAIIGMLWYRRQRLKTQLSAAQLEQRLLRTQMEPHFIFNILSQLQAFIQSAQMEKAQHYLVQFSRLLRLILTNTRRAFVPLRDEVEALQSYLYLEQVNYEGQFTYELEVYDGYEDDLIRIPPMVIQPFVENAIHHGVRQLERDGLIQVRIQRGKQVIHCTVEDNGPGLQQRAADAGKPSISTPITHDRLALLQQQTGVPASLQVIDKKQDARTGVIVELIIPFRLPSRQP